MSNILDLALAANISEPEAVAEAEYQLLLVSAKRKDSKSGNSMVEFSHEIVGDVLTPPVFYYLILPTDSMPQRDQQRRLLDVKRYCDAFNIPIETFAACVADDSFEDIIGSQGWAHLVQNEYEGRISNKIKRFIKSA